VQSAFINIGGKLTIAEKKSLNIFDKAGEDQRNVTKDKVIEIKIKIEGKSQEITIII
jgi:hypothetical protein